MAMTLRELLGFEVFRATSPEVLCGTEHLDREVRWVHSSEIYEIGPLLSGGELLLTTGLGLAGADAGARRHYLRELAARGVAGLCLELGRTFAEVPDELVDEARRLRFPLVVLRDVVPFVRVTEVANTAIIDYSGHRLRTGDAVTRALNEALIAGAGVGRLLVIAAGVLRCPLVVAAGGALVAEAGVDDDHAAWTIFDAPAAAVPITLHGHEWGRLAAGAGSPLPVVDLSPALDRVGTAIALALLRVETPPTQRDRQAAALLADMLADDTSGEADLAQRAAVAGFRAPVDAHLVGAVVTTPDAAAGLAVLRGVARILGTAPLCGRVGQASLGVLVVPAAGAEPLDAALRALSESVRRTGATQLQVTTGLPVPPGSALRAVGRSLREARALSALSARQLGTSSRPLIVDARSRLTELLLADRDPDELRDLAARVIGALVRWDEQHGSELVRTLEVHLQCGGSATRTANALHLGRQAMYQRIERIESVLGHPVSGPELTGPLLLATCAWRMASGAG